MTKQLKILIAISFSGLIVSGASSWLFGGYNPRISFGPTIWTVLIFFIAVIVPILILIITSIYGMVGLFKKDYKRFFIAVGSAILIYWLLQLLTFPPLFIK